MIYVVTNNKGGVGKSLLSHQILPLLVSDNFEVLEIDNNNNTAATFSDSKLLKDKTRRIKVKHADDELDDVFFEAMSNEKDIIVDGGGGDDSNVILKLLSEQPQENIKYVIPFMVGSDTANAEDTYNRIPNKDNVLFILNSYHDIENLTEEFLFFMGDKASDNPSLAKVLKEDLNYMLIPFSSIFKQAQNNHNMTIKDLADLSEGLKPEEASQLFLEKSGGDKLEYRRLYKRYKLSLRAKAVVDTIRENLSQIDTIKS